jgi:hypothetical protein
LRLGPRAQAILGLAVAALLAATALAVRARHAASVGPPDPAPGRAAGEVVDVSGSDATLDLGDVRVLVSAGPRPLAAFARSRFRVRVESDHGAVPVRDPVVTFAMTMPMGDHRHALAAGADGWQEAEAVLPSCVSGNRRWLATLSFTLDGRPRTVLFAFDLEPPAAAGRGDAGTSR